MIYTQYKRASANEYWAVCFQDIFQYHQGLLNERYFTIFSGATGWIYAKETVQETLARHALHAETLAGLAILLGSCFRRNDEY